MVTVEMYGSEEASSASKSCSEWTRLAADATFSHFSQNCAISRPSSSVTSSRPVSFPLASTPSHDEETTQNNACSTTSDSEKEEVRTTGESSNSDKLKAKGLPPLFLIFLENFGEAKVRFSTKYKVAHCHCICLLIQYL